VGTLSKRPKRLFHAIVACGVTMTSCGGMISADDAGADAAADAKAKDQAAPDSPFQLDAQSDAFDPPDVVDTDVVVIKPPPIH
jgi:hypothetical protein